MAWRVGTGVRIAALVAVLGVATATTSAAQGARRRVPGAVDARPAPLCRLDALPGLTRHLNRAIHDSQPALADSVTAGGNLAPGPAADFERVARAVLREGVAPLVAAAVRPDDAVGEPSALDLPCPAEARTRDLAAWRLALSGYSAREIADVIDGHLTTGDLDEARRRLMAGQPRALVATFLDARWRERPPPALARAPEAGPAIAAWPDLGTLDLDLDAMARAHGVAPLLVRAVVAAESAGNPRAVSPAGAIGLMQLMPATAAAIGVNPWRPQENLRGGIVYLASQLRAFAGDTRLALIAYNAGPQHARDVRDGRAVAYRETRRYLDAIHARYPLASR